MGAVSGDGHGASWGDGERTGWGLGRVGQGLHRVPKMGLLGRKVGGQVGRKGAGGWAGNRARGKWPGELHSEGMLIKQTKCPQK